jgi:hypothetical protein
MPSRFLWPILVFAALSLVLAACGDDDDEASNGGADQPAATADSEPDDAAGDEAGEDTGDDGGEGGGFGEGTGTLTIGDETYEITGIGCVFSAEEAQNPDFPFNLSGFGESSTGARAQLSADIYDPSGEERLEGEGVTHNISFDDIEDFENPSVSWSSLSGFLLGDAPETKLTIDGKRITGAGTFDDGRTDEFEMIEGTLEVDCP